MLESAFRLAVDPLLPPPELNFKRAQEALHPNGFTQVFDYTQEQQQIEALYKAAAESQDQMDQSKLNAINS
jgi:hypothetical protein